MSELAQAYGIDVNEMLAQHDTGVTWEAIEEAALQRWQARMKERPAGIPPLETQAGLSQQEVRELVESGIPREQIKYADAVAALFGLDLRVVLREMHAGKTAEEAAREVAHNVAPGAAQGRLDRTVLDQARPMIRPAPLTEDEIAALAARGFDAGEIAEMSDLAVHLGVDPRDVVSAKKPGQRWVQAVMELFNARGHGVKGGGNQ